ncbi:MAG: hypothetical protein LCH69_17600 [Proteobacteria bacterium]|nr:hypothetical protein [Pseudomonadota bacterium]
MTGQRSPYAVVVLELTGAAACDALAAAMAGPAAEAAVPLRAMRRAGQNETLPERRLRALREAEADIVLMVEDTSLPNSTWLDGLRQAFARDEVAMAWGPVAIDPALPARFRALGRLEYGRFDGRRKEPTAPGNVMALRRAAVLAALAPGEGIIEHKLAHGFQDAGLKVVKEPALGSVYARPDRQGARLATRYGHGRIFGAGREGSRVGCVLRALVAMPVLSARAASAAIAASPPRGWLPELPWIVIMASAWSAGELTGLILGPGQSAGSWK